MKYRTKSTYKIKVIKRKKQYSVHNCSIIMSISALSKCKRTECPNLTLEQPSASIDANATCYDSSAKYLPQQNSQKI